MYIYVCVYMYMYMYIYHISIYICVNTHIFLPLLFSLCRGYPRDALVRRCPVCLRVNPTTLELSILKTTKLGVETRSDTLAKRIHL